MNVAIVTGASRGIGRSTALELSKEYFVVVNYLRNKDKAIETVALIEEKGGNAIAVQGDVSNYEDVKNLINKAAENGDIKVVINNAGVYDVRPFSSMLPSEWEHVVLVNLYGTMNVTHAALEKMESGTIVNVSSVIGIHPIPNAAPYCASKAGVVAFTKSIASELAPKIKVVCVAPGPTDTDMLRKFHSAMFADPPDKVAKYIIYAVSSGKPGECIEVH